MDTEPLLNLGAQIIILLALASTFIYILIVGFHWWQYGSSRTRSLTALVIFLAGAGLCIASLITGYFLMF